MASGDGYNQRYDNIIAVVARKSKCVNDVIMWDNDDGPSDHRWRVINYLILVGSNRIILNPKKFQFCQREVEFAGFSITKDDVKPLPKYRDGIRNFPRPINISDVRSFFGLAIRSPTTPGSLICWLPSSHFFPRKQGFVGMTNSKIPSRKLNWKLSSRFMKRSKYLTHQGSQS